MKKSQGFTFIEIIIFIMVLAVFATTILLGMNKGALQTPALLNNTIAGQATKQCMEALLGQRELLGYSAITCPSTTVPVFCTVPTGFTMAVNITCTTINGDSNYITIAMTVSGNGNSNLTTLVANY